MKIVIAVLVGAAILATATSNCFAQKPKIVNLVPGSWYAYKKGLPLTAGCKNPSFVAKANRILRNNEPDPQDNFKQEGCTADWGLGVDTDPLKFKFKVVRSYVIDGKTIVEKVMKIYYSALGKVEDYTLFIDADDINPLPLAPVTLEELKKMGM